MDDLLEALREWILDCDIMLAIVNLPQEEMVKRVESLRRRIAETLEIQMTKTDKHNIIHDELCALILGDGDECTCADMYIR